MLCFMASSSRRRVALVVVFLLVVVGGVVAALVVRRAPADEVSRVMTLIDEEKYERAAVAIAGLHDTHPERAGEIYFLEGYLAAARQHLAAAARLYAEAAQEQIGRSRGAPIIYDQMTEALKSPDCQVRTAAARTLGVLGEKKARGPIEAALAREKANPPAGEGTFCRFEATAETALAALK